MSTEDVGECCEDPGACKMCEPPVELSLQQQVTRLSQENLRLRTVMLAAADELLEQWDAHLDADGFGPRSLLRHLQEGTGFYPGYLDAASGVCSREER